MAKVSKESKKGICKNSSCHHTKRKTLAESASHIPGRVIVKYDVGFNNVLYIRGQGAGLSWDKGVPLKNVSRDEWIWEPSIAFNDCEFKVLINDSSYEGGENHHLAPGASFQYTPSF